MYNNRGINIGGDGLPRGWIDGLTLSLGSTPTTMLTLAAGAARDALNSFDFLVGSPITNKVLQTTGAWSSGSSGNCLDTGARAVSSWYHIFLLANVLTGDVDFIASLSPSAPTIPTGYDSRVRRIGAVRTDAGGLILAFRQIQDEFTFSVVIADISVSNQGTSGTLYTVSVPTGIKVKAIFQIFGVGNAAANNSAAITSPDDSDEVSDNVISLRHPLAGVTQYAPPPYVWTNTSAQIRIRAKAASTNIELATRGWIDPRGTNG